MDKISEANIGVIKDSVEDERSKKIMFVSHCLLNQNAKVRGIAKFPAANRQMVDLLLDNDIAIFQMPCPEMELLGPMRWGMVKAQYSTLMFRDHCHELAKKVIRMVVEYRRAGYEILGFVMIDGSPVCGLNSTPVPADENQMWGGMVWYTPKQRFAAEQGVYCEELQKEAIAHGIDDLPYASFPEADEVGITFDEAMESFKRQFKLE